MRRCLLCGQYFTVRLDLISLLKLEGKDEQLCSFCRKRFKPLENPACLYCSKPLNTADICSDCQEWKKTYGEDLLVNHSLFYYNDAFHDLMVSYKRYGDYRLREVMQALIRDELKNLIFDYYVPIPTSPEHQKKRQYDTIQGIFADLVPLNAWLKKKTGTGAQGEKNRAQRLLTEQGFLIDKKTSFPDNINQGRILLLDDIYTTGRTLYHARDKLRDVAPQAVIESFSICR